MKILVIVCFFAVASALPAQDASKAKSKKHIVEIGGVHYDIKPGPAIQKDYLTSEYIDVDHAATHDEKAVDVHGQPGFSVGGSLVSIAQGTTFAVILLFTKREWILQIIVHSEVSL